jgi:hypothetical protein
MARRKPTDLFSPIELDKLVKEMLGAFARDWILVVRTDGRIELERKVK